MKRQIVGLTVMLAVLAGCGGGSSGKPSCSAAGSCGAGSFCAHTPDGNVCWKDATPPVISAWSMTCSTPTCRRDSVLTVSATVADESYGNAMGEVTVTFDELDPEHPRTLQRVSAEGNEYRLEVPLVDLPFPYFSHDVGGTISARDEAENEAEGKALAAVGVTRERWRVGLPGQGGTAYPLSSPAVVKDDGRIILVGIDGSLHFVNKTGVQERAAVPVGAMVNGPPALGPGTIWLSGQDGTLRKHSLADGAAIALSDCSVSGGAALLGPPAVIGDRAIAVSNSADMLVARTSNSCAPSVLPVPASSPPAIDKAGGLLVVASTTLRKYSVAPTSALSDAWAGVPAPVVGDVAEPIAVDGESAAWTTAKSGVLCRTTTAGLATQVSAEPAAASSGGIILSDGSALIADDSGVARRLAASGSSVWSATPTVPNHPRTGLALGGTDPSLLVPTSDGSLYVLRQSTGELIWSTKLSPQALQSPNIWTEPGATTSTAYLAGANGTLYAVIVDGALDTTAPWPKAYHDPQNTSNAATPF